MHTHVMVGIEDLAASKSFCGAVFAVPGVAGIVGGEDRAFHSTPTGGFGLNRLRDGRPACFASGGTIGFAARSPAQVDAWQAAGIAAGGSPCADPPGVRDPGQVGRIYAACLRDPVGNKLLASCPAA